MDSSWKFVFALTLCLQISLINGRTTVDRDLPLGGTNANQDRNDLTDNFGKPGVQTKEGKISDKNKDHTETTFKKDSKKTLGLPFEDEKVEIDDSSKSFISQKGETGKGKGINTVKNTAKPVSSVFGKQLNKSTEVEPGTAQNDAPELRKPQLGLFRTPGKDASRYEGRLEQKSSQADVGKRRRVGVVPLNETGNVLTKGRLNDAPSMTSNSSSDGKFDNPRRLSEKSTVTRNRSNFMRNFKKSETKIEGTGTGADISTKNSSLAKDSGKGRFSLFGDSTDDAGMHGKPKGNIARVSAKAKSEGSNLNKLRTNDGILEDEKQVPKKGTSGKGITAGSSRMKDDSETLKSNKTKSSMERNIMKESESGKSTLSINLAERSRKAKAKATDPKLRPEGSEGEPSVKPAREMGGKSRVEKENSKDRKIDHKDGIEGVGLDGSRFSTGKEKGTEAEGDGKDDIKGVGLGGIRSNTGKEKGKEGKVSSKGVSDSSSNLEQRKSGTALRTGALGAKSDRENQGILDESVRSKINPQNRRSTTKKPLKSKIISDGETSSRDRTGSKKSDKEKSRPSLKEDVNADQSARVPMSDKAEDRFDATQGRKNFLVKPPKDSKNNVERRIEEIRRERLRKMRIYSDDNDQRVKSSHFIVYGTIGLILLIVLYVVYQKRQKILALIVEGRRQRGNSGSGERSRRGSGSIAYKPLSSKEEAGDERPESLQKYIY